MKYFGTSIKKPENVLQVGIKNLVKLLNFSWRILISR